MIAAALALLALGCGGSGDDGDDGSADVPSGVELAEAWDAKAAAAYEEAGEDREENFAQGVLVEGCFFLDQEGAEAIAAALGHDGEVEISPKNFLTGPPGEEERMSCQLSDPSATEPRERGIASIGAGTTLATAAQFEERLLRQEGGAELEGTAAGLDPEEVVAAESLDINTFAWVHEDFSAGLGGPAELLSADDGFAALPVVVEEVTRTLTG
jgi:hypothetical protein